MDGRLLRLFAGALQRIVVGRRITSFRWFKPILSMRVQDGPRRSFLVAVLQTPGPFCFVCDNDPLDGVDAQELFQELHNAEFSAVGVPEDDRVLALEAVDTAGPVNAGFRLALFLYGSFGRAELTRDGVLLHRIGTAPRRATKGPSTGLKDGWAPGEGEAFYLVSSGRPGSVRPAADAPPGATYRFGPFEDVIAAVGEAGMVILEGAYERIVDAGLKPALTRIANRKRLLADLREQLARVRDHQKIRREAEILASYQSRIKPGAKKIDLPDLYDPSRVVRFELDPAAPIQKQIDKRFKQAGKLRRSETHTRRRIDEVENELKELSEAVEAVRSAAGFAGAVKEVSRLAVLAGPSPRAGDRKQKAGEREGAFRRFDLDQYWFVLVGRSNKENDELTFHTASPSDLWFHAQHVPGSHVVLKSSRVSDSPPARIVEKAASIAAYYSKAKHSSLVPVIYTQRKYVRKPRGAKPGQVVCEREKTVVVKPVLPGASG